MNTHLQHHEWLAGGRYSIADIALYGYTQCADEGGFNLGLYPAVQRWLASVEAQPGYIPMSETW